MGKNVIGENGFSPTGFRKHLMNRHTVPYRSKGVSRKIEIGHGVHHKGIFTADMADKIAECMPLKLFHIGFPHPGHHLVDHITGGKGRKIFGHDLRFSGSGEVRLPQYIVNKVLFHLFVHDGFLHQILQINNFRPVFPEKRGKGIVFLPGDFQIWNIIKQQAVKIFRH